MEALIELCDLVAQNPTLFSEKLSWICNRCPPPSSLHTTPSRLTRSHLNAVLATARFLSKCPYQKDDTINNSPRNPKSVVVDFLLSIPASFNVSFWPLSFSLDAISSFFSDLLAYVAKAGELSPDFSTEAGGVIADIVIDASAHSNDADGIARVFLTAVSRNCPALPSSDAERLVKCLLEQFVPSENATVSGLTLPILPSSETTSSQGSPMVGKRHQHLHLNGDASPASEITASSLSSSATTTPSAKGKGKEESGESAEDDGGGTGESSRGAARSSVWNGSIAGRSSLDNVGGFSGPGDGVAMLRQQVAAFEEESVEGLEKQEIAFRLFAHILDKGVKARHVEQVRKEAAKQLKSLPTFLKANLSLCYLNFHFSNTV